MDCKGLSRLVTAVFTQATADLRKQPTHRHYREAQEFVQSDWFGLMCEALDVDENVMRSEMKRRMHRGDPSYKKRAHDAARFRTNESHPSRSPGVDHLEAVGE